ncbi:protein draper-like isoform X2 [Kogia breviceps]|uniref:protein draper-like isoform X2 n=1 Tax=Kogia breviceps TaxID=27615 RepID=UPI0034D2FAFA
MGARCQQGCPLTRYGPNCELKCTCKNGGLCNPVDGSCTCALGWTRNYCEKGVRTVEFAAGFLEDVSASQVIMEETENMKAGQASMDPTAL